MRKRKSDYSKSAEDYVVGYGRPPKGTRFQPGKSGNPRGRRKGAMNTATMANAALDKKIPVTEKGVRRHMSVREVAFRRLAEKAVSGDLKTLAFLLAIATEAPSAGDSLDAQNVSQQDAGIIEAYFARLQSQEKSGL